MQRRTEVWILGIFGVLIVLGIIAASFFSGTVSPNSNFTSTKTATLDQNDWVRTNNAQAKVTLIEYGDFECPACAQYESVVEAIMQKYSNDVILVFRNYPLTQIHPVAMISAQAAGAAGLQNKFWEMHDLLYKKQSEWSTASADAVVSKYFDGYAQSLGLDVKKFDSDINSTVVKAKIQKDIDSGDAARVDHTPTFFINLEQIPNPGSYAAFDAALSAAVASSTAK